MQVYCCHRVGDDLLINLADLGFHKGEISETIVSTFDVNGQPNAAPMGVVAANTGRLQIRPFLSSLTYKNLQTTKCAVVNVTADPELFYLTAFKEANPNGNLPDELFERAEAVDAPRLLAADACIEVAVIKADSFGVDRADFLCKVKRVAALKTFPRVYCRAQYATIEAIIHATRIKPFISGNADEKKQANKLIELVEVYHDVVQRTAANSRYSGIMDDLLKKIDLWRKQK